MKIRSYHHHGLGYNNRLSLSSSSSFIVVSRRLRFQRITSQLFLRCFLLLLWISCCCFHNSNNKNHANSIFFVTGETIRRHNLDYFDVDTLDYYLHYLQQDQQQSSSNDDNNNEQQPLPYDVAVLFYAQWCKNCHALAPTWDQIARILKAGTGTTTTTSSSSSSSKSSGSDLIMGLFDCETDYQHSKLCTDVGVTHYPTILYFNLAQKTSGSSTTSTNSITKWLPKKINFNFNLLNQNKESTSNDVTTPIISKSHIMKFGGNWQYGESILDWLRTMKFISRYQRSTIRTKLLSFFSSSFHKKASNDDDNDDTSNTNPFITTTKTSKNKIKQQPNQLPIGIPPSRFDVSNGSKGSSSSSSSSSTSTKKGSTTVGVNHDNNAYMVLEKKYHQIQNLVVRSETLLDTLLFPMKLPNLVDIKGNEYNINKNTSYSNKTYTDLFLYMELTDSWNLTTKTTTTNSNDMKNDNDDLDWMESYMLITCLGELTMDYCTRIQNHYMYEWITLNPNITTITDDDYEKYTNDLYIYLNHTEPYCNIIDECMATNFTGTSTGSSGISSSSSACRPFVCPFHDDIACRYVTACLSDSIRDEYMKQLFSPLTTTTTTKKNTYQQPQPYQQPTTTKTNDSKQQSGSASTTTTHTKATETKQQQQQQQQYTIENNQVDESMDDQEINNTPRKSSWGLK